jgi:hypothetical protein
MSEQQLYSIREADISAFCEQVRTVVQTRDIDGWGRLYSTFEATSPKPYIGAGGRTYAPVRLTRIEYQSNQPDLSAEAVPEWESPSLRWLVRHFVLAASDLHLCGTWPKFAQWFAINLSDEVHSRGGPEVEEHELFMALFFEPTGEFPEALRVLQMHDSAFESYVSPPDLERLLTVEARVGLLRRLSSEYSVADDGITRSLGAEISGMYYFLALAQSQGRGVYYTQFAT